ncbi:MAG: hypothetical protein ACPG5W_09230, partial [Flavobacteriales bacterium]
MRHVAEIPFTDPVYVEKETSAFTEFMLRFIRDKRDIVFIHLILKILLVIVPVATYLYLPGRFSWWVVALYLPVNWLFFTPPYILMLHCTSHRPLF